MLGFCQWNGVYCRAGRAHPHLATNCNISRLSGWFRSQTRPAKQFAAFRTRFSAFRLPTWTRTRDRRLNRVCWPLTLSKQPFVASHWRQHNALKRMSFHVPQEKDR